MWSLVLLFLLIDFSAVVSESFYCSVYIDELGGGGKKEGDMEIGEREGGGRGKWRWRRERRRKEERREKSKTRQAEGRERRIERRREGMGRERGKFTYYMPAFIRSNTEHQFSSCFL